MLLRKTVDDRGQQPARDRLGSSDPYLAGRRIGEVLDALAALSYFLECAQASPQQCTAIGRGLDAFGSAIEKPYPDRALHVGDRLRYRRLRDREPLGGLAHAAELGDRQQDVKVVQFEPAADAIVPFHCDLPGKLWRRGHRYKVMSSSKERIICLSHFRLASRHRLAHGFSGGRNDSTPPMAPTRFALPRRRGVPGGVARTCPILPLGSR